MNRSFIVQTAAESTDLVTLAAVKTEFNISGSAEDAYLEAAIKRATAAVVTYLRVPKAQDGTATLARETLVETFRFTHHHSNVGHYRGPSSLILSRRPATSVASVVAGEATLDVAEYALRGPAGLLTRLRSDRESHWHCNKVVVTYDAGWVLSGDDRTLPYDIEAAVIDVIKLSRSSRTRDPLVKAVEVVDIDRKEYWVGGTGGSSGKSASLPPDIAARLDPYRYTALC